MSNTPLQPAAKPGIRIDPPVFLASVLLVLLLCTFAVGWPQAAAELFAAVQAWVIDSAGWFYVLVVALFLLFVVLLALSDYGRIKLGPDHSRPDYSYASWIAMLFSAGMGIGLMFFGVAEPVMHYGNPPTGEAHSVEAARQAMRITFFHWGIHAWAIYAVVALALAYFAYRHGLPLTVRSALYPLIGKRIHGPIGQAVDTFAVLGTLFGVATSLGLGVVQVNAGLSHLFGLPTGIGVQIALIAGITALATISVGLGLDAGIRRLSELNMLLAAILLLFVLLVGPTVFLLQTLVQNTGMYLSRLVDMTFNLYAYEPGSWIGGWTLFYWGWWIAWSPFVGMFIARISRGRTIREFVTGVLLVPVGFTFLWLTVFGDTAIHMVMIGGITELADAVSADSAVALFRFLELLPLSSITSLLAVVLVVIFFVTSSDSGSLVVDMLTSGGDTASPLWQRVFWAVLEGVIAATLLLAGGLAALQTAAIASALPFSIVMLLMCWGLWKALRVDGMKRVSLGATRVEARSLLPSLTWQQRLRAIVHHPRREEVAQFLAATVRPALLDVVGELRRQSVDAEAGVDADGSVWVAARHGPGATFEYAVRARAYDPPAFVLRDTQPDRVAQMKYFRAEVHLREGGQDYDIMGWSREALIDDVLDQYQRHLLFLQAVHQTGRR